MIKKLIERFTKSLKEEKIISAIEEEKDTCAELNIFDKKEPYLGVPAPAYLPEDPWFSTPVLSEKQFSVKEAHEQAIVDQQILDESESKESADIHQKLYEMSSKNWTTVAETQGGSENFHEGPGGWTSGNGMRQFHS